MSSIIKTQNFREVGFSQNVITPGLQIELEGVVNVRDLGGYKTRDGFMIRPHKLIRSAELGDSSINDINILTKTYKLSTIVDFRTNTELQHKPDPLIENVKYVHAPIMKDDGHSTSIEDLLRAMNELESPEDYLIQANKKFVTDAYSINGYKKFFDVLLNNHDGAVLWHCTAGKDRCGFGTALLLSALGVDRKTIIEDYLLSNVYRNEENKTIMTAVTQYTSNDKILKGINAVLRVQDSYINAAFIEIEKKYGSMEQFLEKALALSDQKIEKLKKMYLIKF